MIGKGLSSDVDPNGSTAAVLVLLQDSLVAH